VTPPPPSPPLKDGAVDGLASPPPLSSAMQKPAPRRSRSQEHAHPKPARAKEGARSDDEHDQEWKISLKDSHPSPRLLAMSANAFGDDSDVD